ncbi:MAG: hypothetical protein LBE35_01440 [Clostridiales bacterium]|jgi:hypothetical protein|nr:hypothetical protein [Clostridiales bacterium]
MREILAKFWVILRMSALLIAGAFAIGIIYGLIVDQRFMFNYAITTGFALGSLAIVTGIIRLILPARLTVSRKLLDDSTIGSEMTDARDIKRIKSLESIRVGICMILVVALIELIAFLI